MSRYEGPDDFERDPGEVYLAPLQTWERAVMEKRGIEETLHRSYMDLLSKYRAKCAECDREKRNAVLWEKEQRQGERELTSLRAAAVSHHFPSPTQAPLRVVCISGDVVSTIPAPF